MPFTYFCLETRYKEHNHPFLKIIQKNHHLKKLKINPINPPFKNKVYNIIFKKLELKRHTNVIVKTGILINELINIYLQRINQFNHINNYKNIMKFIYNGINLYMRKIKKLKKSCLKFLLSMLYF